MNADPPIPDELWQQIPPAAQAAIRTLIQRYERRLADLEARLKQNSTNSSKPPSSDSPALKRFPPKPPSARKAGSQHGHAKARDLQRRRKIAEARRGKPRPPHVREAMLKASIGRRPSEESRRKMSEAHRRRGTLVPGTIPWTRKEDALVRTLPAEEVAKKTGRSLSGVYARRRRLRVPDGRRRG
jgi:hypothetical protein